MLYRGSGGDEMPVLQTKIHLLIINIYIYIRVWEREENTNKKIYMSKLNIKKNIGKHIHTHTLRLRVVWKCVVVSS